MNFCASSEFFFVLISLSLELEIKKFFIYISLVTTVELKLEMGLGIDPSQQGQSCFFCKGRKCKARTALSAIDEFASGMGGGGMIPSVKVSFLFKSVSQVYNKGILINFP